MMTIGGHRLTLALACGLIVCSCASSDDGETAATTTSLNTGGEVLYHYDALGRLVQAVAPDGNSVHYRYDAVGNITSIRRLAAGAFGITDFTPRVGPTSTTVTIFGSGFAATPAGNAVAFNGAGLTACLARTR